MKNWSSTAIQINGNPTTEDRYFVQKKPSLVAVVCDGHAGSDVVDYVIKWLKKALSKIGGKVDEKWLQELMYACDASILKRVMEGRIPMGQGCTCAMVVEDGDRLWITTVGDSSVYLSIQRNGQTQTHYFAGKGLKEHIPLEGGVNMPTVLGDHHLKDRSIYAKFCDQIKAHGDPWPINRHTPFATANACINAISLKETDRVTIILGTDGLLGSEGERILTRNGRFQVPGIDKLVTEYITNGTSIRKLTKNLILNARRIWWNITAKHYGISEEVFLNDLEKVDRILAKSRKTRRDIMDDVTCVCITNKE